MREREVVEKMQTEVKRRYQGRYAVLCRKLGNGWYRMRVSRVLSNPNPGAADLFAVCLAAGVSLAPLLNGVGA